LICHKRANWPHSSHTWAQSTSAGNVHTQVLIISGHAGGQLVVLGVGGERRQIGAAVGVGGGQPVGDLFGDLDGGVGADRDADAAVLGEGLVGPRPHLHVEAAGRRVKVLRARIARE